MFKAPFDSSVFSKYFDNTAVFQITMVIIIMRCLVVCQGKRHLWDPEDPYYGWWGRRAAQRAGLVVNARGFLPRFGPQMMRKTLVLLVCVYFVLLCMHRPKNPNPSTVRLGPLFICQRGRH